VTTDSETSKPWEELLEHAENESPAELAEYIDSQSASDIALSMSRLSREERTTIVQALPVDEAASLVHALIEIQAVDILESLPPQDAAAILDELRSSEQADLISEISEPEAEAILQAMDPNEAADARNLSRYDEDVAGGLMITEFLSYEQTLSVGEVVSDMRSRAEEYRDYDVQYAYVCDARQQLTGVLRLRDLLLAEYNKSIADLMIARPRSVTDSTTLDELFDVFNAHNYLGLPVVDTDGHLLGVVQRNDVDEAWSRRRDSDFLKVQGIIGGEEIRSMPLLIRSGRRLSWLSVNIVLNVIAASVIAAYQDTLSAVIALAVFLPIISDMSGCSGNQAVAVSLRELSLGLVRPEEVGRVWIKEILVGLLNGVALGLLIGLVAFLWQGNLWLGLVVGSALCINTMVAVSIGGIVPLILRRLDVDPAVAAGPILTTVTDMCGFLLVLALASSMLTKLVPAV